MFLRGLVSVLKGKVFSLFSFRRRVLRRRASIAGLVLALVVGLGVATTGPASAVEPLRTDPNNIVGGTQLDMPRVPCTAAFVLSSIGFWDNLTAYRRAIRYVATTGHCGNEGDVVKVGGSVVGKVYYKADDADLMLVRVVPTTRRSRYCHFEVKGYTCTMIMHSAPRAFNRVIIYHPGLHGYATVPVVNYSDGAGNALFFCTSGIVGSYTCLWRPISPPEPVREGEKTAEGPLGLGGPGDSGGPVFSSTNDRNPLSGVTLYGMIVGGYRGERERTKMRYLSAAFFLDGGAGTAFSLAPS